MATYILNKDKVKTFKLKDLTYNVLIRITNPEDEFTELKFPQIYKDVLELKFYDFEEEMAGLKVFDDYLCKRITDFFELHRFCKNMVVHCDMGMSRSAAVAVGWFLMHDNNHSIYQIYHNNKHKPNQLMVRMFAQAYHNPKILNYIENWKKNRLKND